MTKRKEKQRAERDKLQAVTEMEDLHGRLHEAYTSFNATTDTDAMDACIYEINALRARYNTSIKHYRGKYL
jgi:hypothetical protein